MKTENRMTMARFGKEPFDKDWADKICTLLQPYCDHEDQLKKNDVAWASWVLKDCYFSEDPEATEEEKEYCSSDVKLEKEVHQFLIGKEQTKPTVNYAVRNLWIMDEEEMGLIHDWQQELYGYLKDGVPMETVEQIAKLLCPAVKRYKGGSSI